MGNWPAEKETRSVIEQRPFEVFLFPIGSMYAIYANIWGILMVNVTIYGSTMDPMGMENHRHLIDRSNEIMHIPSGYD